MERVDHVGTDDEGVAQSESLHALIITGQRGEQDVGG
jgi:hypothetical protein